MPSVRAVLALVFALLAGCAPAVPAPARPAADTFDTLEAHRWYLPTRDGHARLFVTEIGQGPPVIVLHGGPGNDFHYLVRALRPHADRARFILFDQRGSLMSPVEPDQRASLTLDNLVDDLDALREALGAPRAVLLGHSWGTFLAGAYYRAHPDRVAGLMLTATAPPRCVEGATFLDVIKAAHAVMKPMQDRPEVRAELDAIRGDGARDASAKARIRNAATNVWHIDRWREMDGGGVYYSRAADDAIGDSVPLIYDTLAPLAAHPIPIAVIQGDRDYLDPGAQAWRAVSPRPASLTIDVLAGAGHYAWIDDPAGFHRALDAALARMASPR